MAAAAAATPTLSREERRALRDVKRTLEEHTATHHFEVAQRDRALKVRDENIRVCKKERKNVREKGKEPTMFGDGGYKSTWCPTSRPRGSSKEPFFVFHGHISTGFNPRRDFDTEPTQGIRHDDNYMCAAIGCNKPGIPGAGFARRTPKRAGQPGNRGKGSLQIVRGFCGRPLCYETVAKFVSGPWWGFIDLESGILDTTGYTVDEYNERDYYYRAPTNDDLRKARAMRSYLTAKAWENNQAKEA
jgi:hypothetical protein